MLYTHTVSRSRKHTRASPVAEQNKKKDSKKTKTHIVPIKVRNLANRPVYSWPNPIIKNERTAAVPACLLLDVQYCMLEFCSVSICFHLVNLYNLLLNVSQ